MAKKSKSRDGERRRRDDPDRDAPNRSGSEHIRRNARPRNGNGDRSDRGKRLVSETVQDAISGMVRLSSDVIEEQIRAGQTAAQSLRNEIASSTKLNSDINLLVENLVATTRDVGATWLDLLAIVMRSIGTQRPVPGGGSNGGTMRPPPRPGTATETGTSGSATTISSITPVDPAIPGVPPKIVVKGVRVRNVTLDLRPPSLRFVPAVRRLLAADSKSDLTAVKFELSPDQTRLVLTVNVPSDQSPGIYTGAVVDSSTNEAGGTVSVTVAS